MAMRRQKGVVKIDVPKIQRGVNGFLKRVHDAFASEKQMVFDGSHTVAARILCEIEPPFPSIPVRRDRDGWRRWGGGASRLDQPIKVALRKTLVNAFGERFRYQTKDGSESREIERFKSRLVRELNAGKGVKFEGDHTQIVRIFRHRVVVRQVTARFIDMIRRRELPEWRKPWGWKWPRSGRPGQRLYTDAFNILALTQAASERRYNDPRWITRYHASEQKRPVRSNEVGVAIVGHRYPVYNWEQCEGEEYTLNRLPTSPGAESIIKDYLDRETSDELQLKLSHKPLKRGDEDKAYYNWSQDQIVLPSKNRFPNNQRGQTQYYATAFHEIAHSTGHIDRLGRPQSVRFSRFGEHQYGLEELVAEITAFLLAMEAGLTSNGPLVTYNDPLTKDSAAYLKNWLNKIEENPNILYEASNEADRAYKYALDEEYREKRREEARERKRKART